MNRIPAICLMLVIMTLSTVLTHSTFADEVSETLQTMEDFHEAELASSKEPLTKLEAVYRENLAEFQKKSQQAGDLTGVIAAKQAIDDLAAGRQPTPSTSNEIRTIQKNYTGNRQKIEAECAKSTAKINQSHLEALRKLVSELTKKGEIENATAVQKKTDEFSATLPSKSAVQTSGTAAESSEWKSKALAEFPDLSNPSSELSKRFQSLKDAKKITPGYFNDPKWPYLLANEANQQVAAVIFADKLTGLYMNGQSNLCYAFQVDETGRVKGIQFHMDEAEGPLISGKYEDGKLVTKWEQIHSGKPHEFTFTPLPDGNLDMDGHHGFKLDTRHHEALRRVTDPAEYAKIYKHLSDAAQAGEMRAIVNKLKPR